MFTILAGLGFVVAFAFALSGLAVYLFNLRPPRWFRGILWMIPVAPVVMLACLVIFALTFPGL